MLEDGNRKESLLRLQDLGFNRLEAEVYVCLLAQGPATAYGVGKQLGKATANVYKAVESLVRQGAVLIEEGSSRRCHPVPVKEFLKHQRQSFDKKTLQVEQSLGQLQHQPVEEGVFRLESATQVFQRGREMLEERCQQVAVLDAFPRPLEALQPAVEMALSRGVEVYTQVYAPTELPGARIALVEAGEQATGNWGGQQLNLIIDGREILLALLSEDLSDVYHGVWSNSRYLSCLLHSGRLAEHTLHRLQGVQGQKQDPATRDLIQRHPFFYRTRVAGHQELVARYPIRKSGRKS